MGTNHMGRQSIRFPQPPVVRGFASVAGKKEREGPLGDQFTATVQDTTFGEKSWERAERRMQQMTLELALEKAGLSHIPVVSVTNETIGVNNITRGFEGRFLKERIMALQSASNSFRYFRLINLLSFPPKSINTTSGLQDNACRYSFVFQ